jgi:hypothetical protein
MDIIKNRSQKEKSSFHKTAGQSINQIYFQYQYLTNQTILMKRFILLTGFLVPLLASAQLRGRVINE